MEDLTARIFNEAGILAGVLTIICIALWRENQKLTKNFMEQLEKNTESNVRLATAIERASAK